MTKKILLLALAAYSSSRAQVLIQEDFTSPFNPTSAGWVVQNESANTSTLTTLWYQGDPSNYFGAYNGQATDYYAADFLSTDPNTAGTISNWLITPTVTIYNGAELQFATRTVFQGSTNFYPDRLQVRMSTAGTTSVIPTGPTSVGTFSNLIFDINPSLNTSTASAASGTVVNGYPNDWAVYTIQISGVTGTVTGRFAFRYFVTNAGFSGTNSIYIGLDAVKYSLPCGPIVNNYTVCTGGTATLAAIGGLASTTYSWSNASTASSIVVTPASTTVYTLYPSNGTVSCGNAITSTVTLGSQLSFSVSASQSTVCTGQTVTLSAASAASTYSWVTPSGTLSGASIVVTPTASATYSVGGTNSSFSCFGGNTIAISVKPSPQLTITSTPKPLCTNDTLVIIGASGANSYTLFGSTQNPVAVSSPSTPGTYTYEIYAENSNGCYASKVDSVIVLQSPTVSVTKSSSSVCVGNSVTLSASGASTYTWTGANPATTQSFSYTSATAGVKQFSVVGADANGCTNMQSISVTFNACTSVLELDNEARNVLAYPNPFSAELKVSGLTGKVEVINAIGENVISANVSGESAINTSSLGKGVYFVKFFNENGNHLKTEKLIKN